MQHFVSEKRTSAKSVTDIYYLTHRLTHSDAETRKILSKLFTLFHLLDTTSLDCRKAISSEIGDYEDAIMVETAIRSEIDCIVTRNVKDYTKSSVKVCEPAALIKLLEEKIKLSNYSVQVEAFTAETVRK